MSARRGYPEKSGGSKRARAEEALRKAQSRRSERTKLAQALGRSASTAGSADSQKTIAAAVSGLGGEEA